MDTLYAVLAVLTLNVVISSAVWFRLGNLTAKVEHVDIRVSHLERVKA